MGKSEWQAFLDFECENLMFDFVDDKGLCVWDLVRSSVYSKILGAKTPASYSYRDLKNRTRTQLLSLPLLIRSLLSGHKDYFFYLTSRNLVDGKLFDQIAISQLETLGYDNCYLVESYADPNDSRLVYPDKPSPSVADLFRFLVRKKYDFSKIIEKVLSKYPAAELDIPQMQLAYKRFYGQYMFYHWLFKRRHFKSIFVVQNNLQKGMYYAAQQLGIPVIEFQHGIVNKSHMAYSYPDNYDDLGNKIYVADKVLSFAPFWFNNVYNPRSKFIPIGNDYTAPVVKKQNTEPQSFVVVSANIFGQSLKELVLNVVKDVRSKDYHFYFKLHPNQFWQFEEYEECFKDIPQIEVISNQKSMQQLLETSESLLVIQSTAVYEALYAGVKVFVYRGMPFFRVHEDVAQQTGVYFVDDADSMIENYERSKAIDMKPDLHYFSKFRKEAFLDAIKQ